MNTTNYDQLIDDLEDLLNIIESSYANWFGGSEAKEIKSQATINNALEVLRQLNAQES